MLAARRAKEEVSVASYLAEEVLDELQHLGAGEDLLGVHVEALEELAPGPSVARLGSHGVPDLVEELALNAGIVDERRVVEVGISALAVLSLVVLVSEGVSDE